MEEHMFTLTNEAKMGSEYPSSKKVDVCDLPCYNLSEPNKIPLSTSGSDASGYLGLKDKQDNTKESVNRGYKRKAPGTPWATYDTGDE
jgi:hypothetical protein